ncbi:unnamed protein product, partial [Rotaria sp. Silwood1]
LKLRGIMVKHTTEWEEFSDIECEIIEDAFNNENGDVELDLSVIDLKTSIMTMKHDKLKQYSIKRMDNVPKRLRKERFCPILKKLSEMADDISFVYGIGRSKRHFAFSYQQEYFVDMPQSIGQAAAGILLEGEKLGHGSEAQWIANYSLEDKYKSKQEIDERCIALYTRKCFLYKLLNKTLRDDDLDKHETLGPFAHLLGYEGLFNLPDVCRYSKTVYRAMNLSLGQVDQNESSLMEKLGIELCQYLHLADDAVCSGMIKEYNYVLNEILRYSPLSTYEICGVAFYCIRQADIPALQWNVTIPPPTKSLLFSKDDLSSTSTYSVLHLADLHIDREYKPGSNANCGRPLCCRDGIPKSGDLGAGFWGDYRTCDIPQWTAESMLKYIAENEEQIDFIYFTGDIAPHDVWQQTQDKDLEEISFTTRLLKQTFPEKKIYPCVGNHETAPPGLFSTVNMSWLYSNLAFQWINQFGLDEQTRDTILKGGYYTTIIAPKFRLISLNMNYCSEENYWLFINSTDPLGQLQWLIQWLQYAEENQEKVHIIGHQPPRMCMVSFSWAYYSIVNRYQKTITGQFFAHTHFDEFMLFYNETDSKQPISVAYIAPSFTTYPNVNPGYRMFTIDSENSAFVLDHRTVILNLTATNLYNSTKFVEEYSAKSAYSLKDLSPQEWNNFVLRLENDIDGETMGLVYEFFMKSSTPGNACDRICRMTLINCNLKTARAQDTTFCSEII